MEPAEVIDIVRHALYVLVIIAAPLMLTALSIGLIVSLMQALTQIQEATLSFVPKVLGMFAVLALTLPFILKTLTEFNTTLQDKIVHLE